MCGGFPSKARFKPDRNTCILSRTRSELKRGYFPLEPGFIVSDAHQSYKMVDIHYNHHLPNPNIIKATIPNNSSALDISSLHPFQQPLITTKIAYSHCSSHLKKAVLRHSPPKKRDSQPLCPPSVFHAALVMNHKTVSYYLFTPKESLSPSGQTQP